MKLKHATLICRDNKGVIQNCIIPDSLSKKKHFAIAYHNNIEAYNDFICHQIKIDTKQNLSDMLTKALTGKMFWYLYGKLTTGSN